MAAQLFIISLTVLVQWTCVYSYESDLYHATTMGPYSDTKVVFDSLSCPYFSNNLTMMGDYFPNIVDMDNVTVPSDKSILLQQSALPSGMINRITVKSGGSLVFENNDIDLHVREIVVESDGALLIGSETCRMNKSITITFHGSKSDSAHVDSPSGVTSKGLLVHGKVDMHGALYYPTWTRLAKTADINSTSLFLQDRVNWKIGQSVAVTTTVHYDCADSYADEFCNGDSHQNEIRTIVGISMDDMSEVYEISLNSPLTYHHYGGHEYQAEVMLLNRSILLMGEDSADDFGGHTKVIGEMSEGRFSGVHAKNMGQLNILGRYPFHFHLMMNASTRESYFQDCLVTDSPFRSFVVHGTNYTRVSRSVAYNVKGMSFYLEDGVEENNVFEYNLAAFVAPIYRPANGGSDQLGEYFEESADLIIPSDTSACGFYVSNAMNTFIGNAASGGWCGFAFPNIPAPLGAFKDTLPADSLYNPIHRPLLKFYGNTAHSTGFYWRAHGSAIYVGAWLAYDDNGKLTYDSGRHARDTYDAEGQLTFFYFENTKAFLVNKGISHWGNNAEIFRYECHDFRTSAMLFGSSAVGLAIMNVVSNNPYGEVFYDKWKLVSGFQYYDTWVQTILVNITFRNFLNYPNYCSIRYLDHSDEFLPQGINTAMGITFENVSSQQRICLDNCGPTCGTDHVTMASRLSNVWDFDGSVTGLEVPTIIGSNIEWWRADDSCQYLSDMSLWSCPWRFDSWGIYSDQPNLEVPNRTIVYIQPEVEGLTDGCDSSVVDDCGVQYANYTTGRMSHFGSHSNDRYVDMSPWSGVTGISSMGWYWRPKSIPHDIDGAPSKFTLNNYQMARDSFIVLAVAYPSDTTFSFSLYMYGSFLVFDSMNMSTLSEVLAVNEHMLDVDSMVCEENPWYSMCTITGGKGFKWHFDGKHLYLRLVPFSCYNRNRYKYFCPDSFYEAFGARVWDIETNFVLNVHANCEGCPVQSTLGDIKFYEVQDEAPSLTIAEWQKQQQPQSCFMINITY